MIEDDRSIINAIQVALEFRWPEATLLSAVSGNKGVLMVKQENPDIVLLDVNLPDIDGFTVLKQIRHFSPTPVIILTVRSDDVDVLKGLEAGADDYITKPFNYMTLLARIKAVLRRSEALPSTGERESVINSRLRIDFINQKVKVDDRVVTLTPGEYRLLTVLAKNRDHVVDYETLNSQVWGKDFHGDTENIRIYVRRLREKLEDSPPSMILNKRGQGYLLKS